MGEKGFPGYEGPIGLIGEQGPPGLDGFIGIKGEKVILVWCVSSNSTTFENKFRELTESPASQDETASAD